jgi:predicted DNA-binding transcriptional regulator AlpA
MATLRIFGKTRPPQAIQITGPRVLTYEDLRQKGICYSKTYLRRLYESDRFPKPFKLSARKLVWRESEIESWLEEKRAESE